MKIVKRVGLVALLAVGVTLLANTPARAADTYELTNTGVEPGASGTVTYNWKGNSLTVKCEGLRPLSPYVVVYHVWGGSSFLGTYTEWEYYEPQSVETDKKGALTIRVPIHDSYSSGPVSSGSTRSFTCVKNDADPPQTVLYPPPAVQY